jgi:hypothetical protein
MSYIDDLLGKDFEKKRIELERKLKRYSTDHNIISDAISREILVQLERKLKGKEFPRVNENSKQDQDTYEANCIFTNCKRRIFAALKKNKQKANLETNEIAEKTSSELKNGDYDKTILIDGEALFNEITRRGIIHRRGKITQKEIEIWYSKLYGNYTYDDIEKEYDISYDMAKQAVSKVKWAVEELKNRKLGDGTAGMFFITTNNYAQTQINYTLQKYEEEITEYSNLKEYLISIIYDEDCEFKLGLMGKFIETQKEEHFEIINSVLFELVVSGDISENEFQTLTSKLLN